MDLPQLGTPTRQTRMIGLEAPLSSSFLTFSLAAFLIKVIKACILVLCWASIAMTKVRGPCNFFCQSLVITGSARSVLFKMIRWGLSPTSSLIIGFLEALGIRASKTSITTSIKFNFSSS